MTRAKYLPVVVLFGAFFVTAGHAWARNGGLAVEGCSGCHSGTPRPTITITADPARVEPGQAATLTIHIARPGILNGGFYLLSTRKGTLSAIETTYTRALSANEMVHSRPKPAAGGEVAFQVRWTAPAVKAGVDFDVYAVSGNANNNRSGDAENSVRLNYASGCDLVKFYVDNDGDGFGVDDPMGMTAGCELGPGLAAKGGDCNDNDKEVFPGHPEVCNFKDDNCDGKINEGLGTATLYRDGDGDGYGARNTTDTRMGCAGNMGGYAPNADDCDDNDKSVNPMAMEICNGKDDNCNGKVDDVAAIYCGQGWCRRSSSGCGPPSACRPGDPRPEMCNNFDDDCDGVNDNGKDLCPAGQLCFIGMCLTKDQAADAAAAIAAMDAGREAGPAAGIKDASVSATSSADRPATVAGPATAGSPPSLVDHSGSGCAIASAGRPAVVIVGAWAVVVALTAWARRRRR